VNVASATTHTVDRYLETIYYIAAEGDVVRPGRLSSWLGVSAPTVTEALRRLERDGWIITAADRSVTLTEEGARVARAIVRRHRVLERWLTDVLGFDWAAADLEAERIASAISDEVIARIDQSMGAPATCPHGNAIPGREPAYGPLTTLGAVERGARVRVRRISEVAEHEGQVLLRLLARHAIGEGCELRVLERDADGTVRVAAGPDRFALPADAAAAIWVETDAAVAAGR
jgi:DtxR family Mn-dependent transcriptional regulator